MDDDDDDIPDIEDDPNGPMWQRPIMLTYEQMVETQERSNAYWASPAGQIMLARIKGERK